MTGEIIGYPITDLEQLESIFRGRNELDCYVKLNFGKSGKHLIMQEDGSITVINEIDDTSEPFDSLKEMIEKHSSISKALELNAFYVYAYEVQGRRAEK